ncbi:hypothetical protein SAMN04488004_12243 [Loktanella salsilacus]|uniref:Uncharacterized protein n=1 Tax=Loktanella salsilacus TaxID=195913 RepID=A0A1I4I3N0_9RHOB|nr:hypothetical protein SAMN04488004_12243 [Loktanella salsilacus]
MTISWIESMTCIPTPIPMLISFVAPACTGKTSTYHHALQDGCELEKRMLLSRIRMFAAVNVALIDFE